MNSATPYSGGMRAFDGITVFAESDDGEVRAFVRACMPIRGALLSICREMDALPGQWWVCAISSPTTIWRDLQGDRWQAGRDTSGQFPVTPEQQLLGQIGRGDLLRGRV